MTLNITIKNVTLSIIVLGAKYCHAECHYVECRFSKCHSAFKGLLLYLAFDLLKVTPPLKKIVGFRIDAVTKVRIALKLQPPTPSFCKELRPCF